MQYVVLCNTLNLDLKLLGKIKKLVFIIVNNSIIANYQSVTDIMPVDDKFVFVQHI